MPDSNMLSAVIDRLVACVHDHLGEAAIGPSNFDLKADGSRVTRFDQEIESDWRDIISSSFPDHEILGEEFGGGAGNKGFAWLLDPIDGTDDFSRGMPLFGYIIAVLEDGSPIAAATGHPALGLDLRAEAGQGVRVNGERLRPLAPAGPRDPAIAIPAFDDFTRDGDRSDLILAIGRQFPNYRVYRNLFGHTSVVCGALDAALEFDVAPWDFVATRLMVEEAGGDFAFFRAITQEEVTKYGVVFGRTDTVARLRRILADNGFPCGSADDFDAGGV